jgi:hypothetical protein
MVASIPGWQDDLFNAKDRLTSFVEPSLVLRACVASGDTKDLAMKYDFFFLYRWLEDWNDLW